MKTYNIKGKKITVDYLNIDKTMYALLEALDEREALSDKEEAIEVESKYSAQERAEKDSWDSEEGQTNYCARCEVEAHEERCDVKHTCGKEEYYDHSKTKMWLVKENGKVEKFEETNGCIHQPKEHYNCADCARVENQEKCDHEISDKQVYDNNGTYHIAGDTCIKCGLHELCWNNKSKQSTSLKVQMSYVLEDHFNGRIDNPNTADKILKLIQSHLLKEIKELRRDQDWVLRGLDYGCAKQDIIKIINNITK